MRSVSTVDGREDTLLPPADSKTDHYLSWGRYPRVAHRAVSRVYWRDQLPNLLQSAELQSLLPYGLGRSYGDSCLNRDRDLVDCSRLNRILDSDWESGRICVEAGISLGDLLEVIVPRGWFLPVTPGTKFVTVGGAIANDIHGKNHHRAGTFGCHVRQFTLCRSDAADLLCSPSTNTGLFRATIGGLGLTGVITTAQIQLKRIAGNAVECQTLPFESMQQFVEISAKSDQAFEYTVAWVDCLSGGGARGIFFRGHHSEQSVPHRPSQLRVPFTFPEFFLNRSAVLLFNRAYYRIQARRQNPEVIHYDPFFYPLDGLLNWNLLYGRRGFLQYQCVVPSSEADAIAKIIRQVCKSGATCFLAVLKAFGTAQSPGMLSFPRPGFTLSLDLPMRGARTLKLLEALDAMVLESGGALYPAKDARMSPAMFQAGFPRWADFAPWIDPKLSSSFWRRVARE